MKRPAYIAVEPTFDEFVTSFGGVKVSSLIAGLPGLKGTPPLNADYIFADDNVIAELKCLEKDTYSADQFRELFNSLITGWCDRGMIQWRVYGGPVLIQSRDLPSECQLELERIISRRLRKVVAKANKQIRQTKKTLGTDNAKGLLLLVSDGNYFLRPEHVLGFVGRIVRDQFSSIHSIVYFTVNAAIDVPTVDKDGLIWIQSFRDNFEPVNPEFLSRLRVGWFQHLAIKLELDIPEYLINDDTLIEKMRFIREIEIAVNEGTTTGRTSATHEFADVYRVIGPTPQTSTSRWQFSTGDLVRCAEQKQPDGNTILKAFQGYKLPKTLSIPR